MRRSLLVLTIIACGASAAHAQLPQTRLYSVFPPGAAPGQIIELRVNTGADLDEVDRLTFSHPGIFATQKYQTSGDGKQQPVVNTFRVAVDASVPPGRYEVRAVGRFGISNPRPLLIDPRRNVQETEPNNDADHAQMIAPGSLVNGQINGAGDVDFVRVSAKQGERLVLDCLAERIDSRLNPVLTIADADGKPVAFAENEQGRDAFLVFDVPADGDYLIQLHDETFAGGSEHIYQLQVHTGPHIRFVMPPAGIPGTTSRFTLYGYNLPGSEWIEAMSGKPPLERLAVDVAVSSEAESLFGTPSIAAGLDFFPYTYSSEAGLSNTIRIGLASESTPVAVEQEPNDQPAAAQQLPVPIDVGGQFATRRDIDLFTFAAKKDQPLWIEVIGQRGGGMLDPYLRLEQVRVDEAGNEQLKELTRQDDAGKNLAANVFDTATDDPVYHFKPPEDGTYRVTLRDRAFENRGDPSLVYRLIVRPLQPDFRLVAIPSGQPSGQTWPVSLRRGDHFALDVLAFRRDGFDGPIEVRPRRLPFGLTTQGTVIRGKDTKGTLVLTAAESAPLGASLVDLVGAARITTPRGEETIQRPVRFGGVVWSRNGNTPAISRLETQFTAAILPEQAPFQVTHTFEPLTVHQGRQLLIPLSIVKRGFDEKLTLKFGGLPKSAKIDKQDLTIDKGQSGQTLRLFVRADSPPGTYVLGGTAQASVPYRRNPERAERLAAVKTLVSQEAQIAKAAADAASALLQKQVAALQAADARRQQAQQAVEAAQDQVNQAQQAIAQAKVAGENAAKQVAALTEQAQQAVDAANESAKVAGESDGPDVKAQAEAAQQSADEKQAALETARQTQTQTQQQLKSAQTVATAAAESLTKAQQEMAEAESARKSAEPLKAEAEARSQATAAAAKQAAQAQQAAEKAATDAENAAKPKNINVTQPIPPFLITVKPAPVVLGAKPAKQDVKQGESVDITVTVKRQNEFAGPVTLSLPLPDGVAGLSAEEATVAADADSAVLKVAVTAEAAEGDVAHLVVRGVMDAGGEAIVEVPISLKVTK